MDQKYYWMWLTRIPGLSRKKIEGLLHFFHCPDHIWNARTKELVQVQGITEELAYQMSQSKKEVQLERWVEEIQKKNIQFFSVHCPEYPEILKNIPDPPYGLYVRGRLPDNEQMPIGLIGSRRCSDYGSYMAHNLAKDLASKGVVVVSGMARGIDTIAHRGALEAKGHTVAVLGNGVDVCYPKENGDLMESIVDTGAVVSEFPPGTQPLPMFFPMRNRIISGLSKAVVVVEAAKKSGSLITADQALEQGRDVYAVPGNATSKFSGGTNELIRQGAKLITSAEEILEEYTNFMQPTNRYLESIVSQNVLNSLAPEENIVYDCISLEPVYIDQLSNKTNYPIQTVQYILMMLELKGFIQQLPGQRYVRLV